MEKYKRRTTTAEYIKKEKGTMEILTKEETKILKMIADGASDEEIAAEVGCSRGSIRITLKSMYRLTNTPNRCAFIAWGFRNGYLQ